MNSSITATRRKRCLVDFDTQNNLDGTRISLQRETRFAKSLYEDLPKAALCALTDPLRRRRPLIRFLYIDPHLLPPDLTFSIRLERDLHPLAAEHARRTTKASEERLLLTRYAHGRIAGRFAANLLRLPFYFAISSFRRTRPPRPTKPVPTKVRLPGSGTAAGEVLTQVRPCTSSNDRCPSSFSSSKNWVV